jgi:uncharacterized coiled-coil DUF342 family protein
LARLAQNHFATRHYLTQQVLPAVQKDLTDLHNYAAELAPESTQAYNEWIDQYKKVNKLKKIKMPC